MTAPTKAIAPLLEEQINQIVDARVEEALSHKLEKYLPRLQTRGRGPRRLAIVASKGTLDMAYPPLILATTAAAMGWEVGIFFTFYGLDIVNRKKLAHLKVPPLGNPAMPVPVPNLVGAIPGMTAMATAMMKSWLKRGQIPSIAEMLNIAQESGVQLFACTTTLGVMGVSPEDLIAGVSCAGAASFLDYAADATMTLFV